MVYPGKLSTKKFIIRYKGLFDFDGLYNMMVQYLKARRYWIQEAKYKHKVPSPSGAEQEIRWTGNAKVNDYIMYDVIIDLHLWDMTEVEVIKEGVKKTLTNARIELIFQGFITIDYEKRFDVSPFWQGIKDWYNKYITKEDIESIYGDTLHYKMQHFVDNVKQFLDMQAKGYEYAGYIGDNL